VRTLKANELAQQLLNLLLEPPADCLHVTDLLSYNDPPTEEQLIRGKVYHLAIESLLKQIIPEKDLIIEKTYTLELKNLGIPSSQTLCFTPDAHTNEVIFEIKSTAKSLNYATQQTSIYTYLLNTYFNKQINECFMITGDLKVYQLNCDPNYGKNLLLSRLRSRLF